MSKKEAYEAGYRAACLAHGLPYVEIKHTQDRICQFRLDFSYENFEYVPNFKDVIIDKVLRKLTEWEKIEFFHDV